MRAEHEQFEDQAVRDAIGTAVTAMSTREIQIDNIRHDYNTATPFSIEAASARQRRLMDAVPVLLDYIDELQAAIKRMAGE